MKKSAILFELIISILILSVVGTYTLLFIKDLYKSNSQNLKILNTKLDFQSTNLFIEYRLKQGVNINHNSNEISFYEVDINGFKSGLYSGFSQLENSTKEYIITPNSYISNTNNNYVWFNTNYFYEIEKSFEDDKIYFKNKTSQKVIYEQYKLLTKESKIYLQNNTLFFNNDILLKNIKSFDVTTTNNLLIIDTCDNSCQNWVITL